MNARVGLLVVAGVAGVAGLAACVSEDPARPPRVGTCTDAGCVVSPPHGGGTTDAGADSVADAAPDAVAVTLRGTVGTFLDVGLAQTAPAAGVRLTVGFDGVTGGTVTDETTDGVFEVAGALASPAAWATVEAEPGATDWLTTLTLVDTADEAPVEPLVVRLSLIDTLLALGQVTAARSSSGAVVMLQVVSLAQGLPAAGARVVRHGGDALLYADAGTWSGIADETDSTGWVLVLNVPASSGSLREIAVEGPSGAEYTAALRVAAGGVTVAGVAVE